MIIVEGLLGYEVHDVIVSVDAHHRSVHPALVLCHEGKVGIRVLQDHGEQTVGEDQVALDEQCVVFLQPFLSQPERVDVIGFVIYRVFHVFNGQLVGIARTYVALQVLCLIAHHDNHATQFQVAQLMEQSVNESYAVYRDHALRVVLSIFAESAAHSRRQDDCLHSFVISASLLQR